MSPPVGKVFSALYAAVHDGFRAVIAGLDDATLNRRPHPEANSIAVLLVHALGSEAECVRSVRGVSSARDRASEFLKESVTAAELTALIDAADADLAAYVDGITDEDLAAIRPRGQRPPAPVVEWLVANYGHAREHLAQAQLTRQLL